MTFDEWWEAQALFRPREARGAAGDEWDAATAQERDRWVTRIDEQLELYARMGGKCKEEGVNALQMLVAEQLDIPFPCGEIVTARQAVAAIRARGNPNETP